MNITTNDQIDEKVKYDNKILRSYVPITKIPDIFEDKPKEGIIIPADQLPIYTVAIAGHVDAGKSTLLGRLLHACGRVKQHTIDAYTEQSKLLQKSTFQYAWVLDSSALERSKGVTIDLSYVEFNSQDRYFTMVDCPGHKDYLKNAITGLSQADVCILALDAQKGLALSKNAREHVICAKASGANSIIVAITKIDSVPFEDRERVFAERSDEIKLLLQETGFAPDRYKILPVNAYGNWNLIDNHVVAKELPFYNGPTLIEALNTINIDPIPWDKPFRMAVEGIHTKVSGTNCVITGKILAGVLKPKDKVVINPGNLIATVRKIHMHKQTLLMGVPNTNVGLDLTGIEAAQIKRGFVITKTETPARAVKEITAQRAVIIDHPTKLAVGSNIIGHYLTGNVAMTITAIQNVYDLTTYKGDFREAQPSRSHTAPGYTHGHVKIVKPKSVCRMTLVPTKPIVVETLQENPKMASIILRDFGSTIGFLKVTQKKEIF